MREHQRLENAFEWMPMQERTRFGTPMPPRKAETRKPVFWITNGKGGLHFVNDSQEALALVATATGGFQTCDNEVAMVESNGYTYKDVKPGEAVKIEEFDDFYDCDNLFQLDITVHSVEYGNKVFTTKPEKGGISDDVLLWDNGETGRYVSVRKAD